MDSHTDIARHLRRAYIFDGIADDDLAHIAEISTLTTVLAGDVIFLQGTNSQELYVIAAGEVDILFETSPGRLSPDNQPDIITTLRTGEAFGEIALLDRGTRSATARSGRMDSTLIVIASDDLLALCETRPTLGFQLMHNLARGLAHPLRTRTNDMLLRDWLIWPRGPR